MDDLYYQKYLKYKNKYLSLKQDLEEQDAGADIKVLYSANVKVSKAELQGVRLKPGTGPGTFKMIPKPKYEGDKVIQFGTVTDQRSESGTGKKKFVVKTNTKTNPYLKIDGKIHEINKGFGVRGAKEILTKLKAKDLESLVGELHFLDKPCHGVGAGFSQALSGSQFCNKDRGTIVLTITSAELIEKK
mgnify:CR=1 FL=1